MIQAFLTRPGFDDQGTFGVLSAPEVQLNVFVGELPWRGNKVGLSRIPAGDYICKPYKSPKFGRCWIIPNVPGRSYVLFHKGNLVGDVLKNYLTHSRGCILPGRFLGKIKNQKAVLNSTSAFSEMVAKIGLENSFKLKIIDL